MKIAMGVSMCRRIVNRKKSASPADGMIQTTSTAKAQQCGERRKKMTADCQLGAAVLRYSKRRLRSCR